MAGLVELARFRTDLEAWELDHLQRLVANWGILADLSFSDLLLFVPLRPQHAPGAALEAAPADASAEADGATAGGEGPGAPAGAGAGTGTWTGPAGRESEATVDLLVVGQVRPATSQTIYRSDLVGTVVPGSDRPVVARCLALGEIIDGQGVDEGTGETTRVVAIPVRCEGRTIAVLTRESAPSIGRTPGELERSYVEIFHRFAGMIVRGELPYVDTEARTEESPRVGDGVVLLDGSARVAYASPNAVSALHRIGIHGSTEGRTFAELGIEQQSVHTAFTVARPGSEEVERGPEVTVLVQCLPIVEKGEVNGALVLLRDISELRRRDRLLLSKDATIREIHHRVKNNLQTISSLLRLQGRRTDSPEARDAIEESVRRIRSIALVHEILSHDAGDDVPFVEIVRPLVRMVEEGLVSPDQPVRFRITGDAGRLPAAVATPLAVVLTELLQNVVDHAYEGADDEPAPGPRPPERVTSPGTVVVDLSNDGRRLTVAVRDDGVGLPAGFTLDRAGGLGLSIVRTLVSTELAGSIDVGGAGGPEGRPGTLVSIGIPLSPGG